MRRRLFAFLFVLICASTLLAQDLSDIQIHGFVSQGFLYSSKNNFYTMATSDGSARWTDGVISFNESLSDKLRIGIQFHVYQFGELGGPNLQIDWASGDYRASDRARFVAGKVKTVTGLFNDSQDVDAVQLWALLPEGIYPTDNKSFNLSHYGGDYYGTLGLGKKGGALSYRGFAGYRPFDLQGGYARSISESTGMAFTTGGSNVFGGDVRWLTPLKGLMVGMTAVTSGLDGKAPTGGFHIPLSTTPTPYAKYERGKFMAAGEYKRNTSEFIITFNLAGGAHFVSKSDYDTRSWYVMSSYRVLPKMQLGAYYSHYKNAAGVQTLPANFSKDWVVSGRYDCTQNLYVKLEGHFIDGTALNYYTSTNPTGRDPKSKLLAAKVGFSF